MTKQLIILLLVGTITISACKKDPPDDDIILPDNMSGVCFEPITGDCADLSEHPVMIDLSNQSCSGYCVMKRFLESCPTDLNINGQDLTVSEYLSLFFDNPDFPFDDVIATNVLVHESMHSISHEEAFGFDDLFILLDCETEWHVDMTITFPSRQLTEVIGPDFRTGRFDGYIDGSEFHVTQTRGVYGLLNEFASYYQSGLATYEMSKSNNLLDDPDKALLYALNTSIPYYEFKYWILTYLIYAEENFPAIYDEILANENFKESFLAIESDFSELVDKIGAYADPLSSGSEVNTNNVVAELGSVGYLEMMGLLE